MAAITVQTTKPSAQSDAPMIALIVDGVVHLMSLAEAGRLEEAIQLAMQEFQGRQKQGGL